MDGKSWLLSDVSVGSASDAPLTEDRGGSEPSRPADAFSERHTGNQRGGFVSQVKGLVNHLIDSSSKLVRRADGVTEPDELPSTTYADELAAGFEYLRDNAQVAFGAFRFHTSQRSGSCRGVQTLTYPTGILNAFAVHTSETRSSKNAAAPEGACQFGLFRSDVEKIWVIARGYGLLGGVLPDWFCLNFMKRATSRLTIESINPIQARTLLKQTFRELADDMVSLLAQIGDKDESARGLTRTGVTATAGIWIDAAHTCVIGICGDQPSFHLEIRSSTASDEAEPYCTSRALFRNTHDYRANTREKARIQRRVLSLQQKLTPTDVHKSAASQPASSNHRRLIAGLRVADEENPADVSTPTRAHNNILPSITPEPTEDSRVWLMRVLQDSSILKYGITRGFGFADSQYYGLCAVPDFVVVQTKARPHISSLKDCLAEEYVLVASNSQMWQVRQPQGVVTHMLRLMQNEDLDLQEALDRVCTEIRIESVTRGYHHFNAAELIVLCIPLSN